MLLKRIKLFAIALIALPLFAVAIFNANTNTVQAVSNIDDDAAAATYKTKCAACHGQKAEKNFDTALKDEEHVQIILKGKKGEKPPFMPEYASKGINAEQAQALVSHMRKLRNPDAGSSANNNSNAKAEAKEETEEKSREAIIAMYKSKCSACHTAKAEKFYDPSIKPEEQAEIILKGKKAEKPPHMPEYASKGVTEKEAKALAAYMIELRTPAK